MADAASIYGGALQGFIGSDYEMIVGLVLNVPREGVRQAEQVRMGASMAISEKPIPREWWDAVADSDDEAQYMSDRLAK
jgi:hypothetical protein